MDKVIFLEINGFGIPHCVELLNKELVKRHVKIKQVLRYDVSKEQVVYQGSTQTRHKIEFHALLD